jgi:hypothetical protein
MGLEQSDLLVQLGWKREVVSSPEVTARIKEEMHAFDVEYDQRFSLEQMIMIAPYGNPEGNIQLLSFEKLMILFEDLVKE